MTRLGIGKGVMQTDFRAYDGPLGDLKKYHTMFTYTYYPIGTVLSLCDSHLL